ncbi:MAG: hypothetical protein R6X20_13595 [Phycisphaerae bacterium]
MTPAIETAVWLRAVVGLGLGAAAVVGLAAVAAWRVRSGAWRRTIWQAAVAAVLLLVAMEATGVGPGAAAWLLTQVCTGPSDGRPRPAVESARASEDPCHGRSCPAVRPGEDHQGARWVSAPTARQPDLSAGAPRLRSGQVPTRRATPGEAFAPVPVPPPARLSEREVDREREGRRGPAWQNAVDTALKRLSALRLLKSLVSTHGKREQVELVEQLVKEEQARYERLLRRGREREGDEAGEEREWHRDRDDDDEADEEREWHRDRDRDADDEGEDGPRRDNDDDEDEEGDRPRDNDDDEGEEDGPRRDRDREGDEG